MAADEVRVRVRMALTGDDVSVQVLSTATGADLKLRVEREYGVPASRQTLSVTGRTIEDGAPLAAFGVGGPGPERGGVPPTVLLEDWAGEAEVWWEKKFGDSHAVTFEEMENALYERFREAGKKQPLPLSRGVVHYMVKYLMDQSEDEDQAVDKGEFRLFVQRFGPFSRCVPKCAENLFHRSSIHPWFFGSVRQEEIAQIFQRHRRDGARDDRVFLVAFAPPPGRGAGGGGGGGVPASAYASTIQVTSAGGTSAAAVSPPHFRLYRYENGRYFHMPIRAHPEGYQVERSGGRLDVYPTIADVVAEMDALHQQRQDPDAGEPPRPMRPVGESYLHAQTSVVTLEYKDSKSDVASVRTALERLRGVMESFFEGTLERRYTKMYVHWWSLHRRASELLRDPSETDDASRQEAVLSRLEAHPMSLRMLLSAARRAARDWERLAALSPMQAAIEVEDEDLGRRMTSCELSVYDALASATQDAGVPRLFDVVTASKKHSAKGPNSESDANMEARKVFWYRMFGVRARDVPARQFCAALRIHLQQEYQRGFIDLDVFTRVISLALDTNADELISPGEFTDFIYRYGPIQDCFDKAKAMVMAPDEGAEDQGGAGVRPAPWFVQYGRDTCTRKLLGNFALRRRAQDTDPSVTKEELYALYPRFYIRPGHTDMNHAFSFSLIRDSGSQVMYSTRVFVANTAGLQRYYQMDGDDTLYSSLTELFVSACEQLGFEEELGAFHAAKDAWRAFEKAHQSADASANSAGREAVDLVEFFRSSGAPAPTIKVSSAAPRSDDLRSVLKLACDTQARRMPCAPVAEDDSDAGGEATKRRGHRRGSSAASGSLGGGGGGGGGGDDDDDGAFAGSTDRRAVERLRAYVGVDGLDAAKKAGGLMAARHAVVQNSPTLLHELVMLTVAETEFRGGGGGGDGDGAAENVASGPIGMTMGTRRGADATGPGGAWLNTLRDLLNTSDPGDSTSSSSPGGAAASVTSIREEAKDDDHDELEELPRLRPASALKRIDSKALLSSTLSVRRDPTMRVWDSAAMPEKLTPVELAIEEGSRRAWSNVYRTLAVSDGARGLHDIFRRAAASAGRESSGGGGGDDLTSRSRFTGARGETNLVYQLSLFAQTAACHATVDLAVALVTHALNEHRSSAAGVVAGALQAAAANFNVPVFRALLEIPGVAAQYVFEERSDKRDTIFHFIANMAVHGQYHALSSADVRALLELRGRGDDDGVGGGVGGGGGGSGGGKGRRKGLSRSSQRRPAIRGGAPPSAASQSPKDGDDDAGWEQVVSMALKDKALQDMIYELGDVMERIEKTLARNAPANATRLPGAFSRPEDGYRYPTGGGGDGEHVSEAEFDDTGSESESKAGDSGSEDDSDLDESEPNVSVPLLAGGDRAILEVRVKGQTPALMAATATALRPPRVPILTALCRIGAKLNTADSQNQTVLHKLFSHLAFEDLSDLRELFDRPRSGLGQVLNSKDKGNEAPLFVLFRTYFRNTRSDRERTSFYVVVMFLLSRGARLESMSGHELSQKYTANLLIIVQTCVRSRSMSPDIVAIREMFGEPGEELRWSFIRNAIETGDEQLVTAMLLQDGFKQVLPYMFKPPPSDAASRRAITLSERPAGAFRPTDSFNYAQPPPPDGEPTLCMEEDGDPLYSSEDEDDERAALIARVNGTYMPSLLHVAVRTPNRRVGIIRALLDYRPTYDEITASAAEIGSPFARRALTPDIDAVDAEGRTALHIAASIDWSSLRSGSGNLLEIGQELVRRIDISKRDVEGWTAIHHSCDSRRLEFVDLLIKAHADVRATTGSTAALEHQGLDGLVQPGRAGGEDGGGGGGGGGGSGGGARRLDTVVEMHRDKARHRRSVVSRAKAAEQGLLRRKNLTEPPLGSAGAGKSVSSSSRPRFATDSAVQPMLDRSATTEAIQTAATSRVQTALHLAARKGYWQICSSLLQAKAEVDSLDDEGNTPLSLAMSQRMLMYKRQKKISEELAAAGTIVSYDPAVTERVDEAEEAALYAAGAGAGGDGGASGRGGRRGGGRGGDDDDGDCCGCFGGGGGRSSLESTEMVQTRASHGSVSTSTPSRVHSAPKQQHHPGLAPSSGSGTTGGARGTQGTSASASAGSGKRRGLFGSRNRKKRRKDKKRRRKHRRRRNRGTINLSQNYLVTEMKHINKRMQEYDSTVKTLFSHGARIEMAVQAAEGLKELDDLMDIPQQWDSLTQTLNQIDARLYEISISRPTDVGHLGPDWDTVATRRKPSKRCPSGGGCPEKYTMTDLSSLRVDCRSSHHDAEPDGAYSFCFRCLRPWDESHTDQFVCNLPERQDAAAGPDQRDRYYTKEQLRQQRRDVFRDKSNQIVIDHVYRTQFKGKHGARLFLYLIFLGLLTAVGILQATRDDSGAFWLQNGLRQTLSADEFPERVSALPRTFETVDSVDEFWQWTRGPLLDVLYPESPPSYWNGTARVFRNGPYVNDQLRLLGTPRLRQVRSRAEGCDVAGDFDELATECFSWVGGTRGREEHADFGSFGPATSRYRTTDELETTWTWGRVAWYDGDGHVVALPQPDGSSEAAAAARRNETLAALDGLRDGSWVDAATRAVFVEFVALNANQNHFVLGQMLVEFPLVGGVVPSSDFLVTRLNRYMTREDGAIMTLELVLLVIFAYKALFALRIVTVHAGQTRSLVHGFRRRQWRLPCDALHDVYSFVNLFVIIGVTLIIGLHATSIAFERGIDWSETADFPRGAQRLQRVNAFQSDVFSVVVLLAWTKLLDYLSVFKTLSRLVVILEFLVRELVNFLALLLIALAAFASAEHISYGYRTESSSTWLYSFITRISITFTGRQITAQNDFNRVLGVVYPLLFAVAVTLILLNLLIALLTNSYESASKEAGASYWSSWQYSMIVWESIYSKAKPCVAPDEIVLAAARSVRNFFRDRCGCLRRCSSPPVICDVEFEDPNVPHYDVQKARQKMRERKTTRRMAHADGVPRRREPRGTLPQVVIDRTGSEHNYLMRAAPGSSTSRF